MYWNRKQHTHENIYNTFRNPLLLALLWSCALPSLVNIYKRKPFTLARSGTTSMFTKVKFLLMSLLHKHLHFMNFIKSVKLILNFIVTVCTNTSWMRHKISALTNHVSITYCYTLNLFRINQFKVGFPLLVIFLKEGF